MIYVTGIRGPRCLNASMNSAVHQFLFYPLRLLATQAAWTIFLCGASLFVAAAEAPSRLVFGGETGFPPFEWRHNGRPIGFNVDLAQAIADYGDVKLKYRLDTWPAIVDAFEQGQVDVVPMFISEQRRKRYLFTSPFYIVKHAIYALEGTPPIYQVEELRGKRVVIERESYSDYRLRDQQINATTVLSEDSREALNLLLAGEADYAILATVTAEELIYTQSLPVRSLGPPFWPAAYAFAVKKDQPELALWLEEALNATLTSGRYQEVYEKWRVQLERGKTDRELITRIIASVIALLALIAAVAAAWSWSLRRKVAARTAALEEALRQNQVAEAHARHLANFDMATGLPKSMHFLRLVDKQLSEEPDPAVIREMLVVQLAELSEVVGLLGKAYSEDLLGAFSRHLQAVTAGQCGYLGRGVFAVFFSRREGEDLFTTLTRWRGDANAEFRPYIEAGSAYWPQHGTAAQELLANAEIALATSVAGPQRSTVYDPSMQPDPLSAEIVSDFRDQTVEGLYAVFQPQVDLATGAVVGAESLVRWQHPVHGLLSPVRFVPIVEKAGLVPQITVVMLSEAVRVAAEARRQGRPCVISVNVSMHDLLETDLVVAIQDVLQRHGGRATDLKLEVTETSVAKDPVQVGAVLTQLHQLGVWVSVDDFGTGYSSLAYLSLFPIQELKIDRVFIHDIAVNAKNRTIVRSTIVMAKELGLRTVAEGAEDEETVAVLREDGCDRVQGYVYSKPLVESEFLQYLAAHEHKSAGLGN
jgi:EAL domain-containing protein (putative c-di-GMP-specific phosphodiesterase class I)/ABC-type amino acid transport substrate-binding protein/GGDEF domain-containing protein